MRDSGSEITFEMNAFYPQSPAVPITNPYMNNNPRKRNKTRQDFGSKSCDVMRDSNSEITFEMAERILSANFRPSIGEEQGREGIFSRGEK